MKRMHVAMRERRASTKRAMKYDVNIGVEEYDDGVVVFANGTKKHKARKTLRTTPIRNALPPGRKKLSKSTRRKALSHCILCP